MNPPSELMFYGAHGGPDCRRAKQFLGGNQIPFKWMDIEKDPAAEQVVIEKNKGKRIILTIVFLDGSILVEPSNAAPAALETSVRGIFAAGVARAGCPKQVASASGEGATAALLIRENLQAR